jgi:hypothetical protein
VSDADDPTKGQVGVTDDLGGQGVEASEDHVTVEAGMGEPGNLDRCAVELVVEDELGESGGAM